MVLGGVVSRGVTLADGAAVGHLMQYRGGAAVSHYYDWIQGDDVLQI